MKRVIAPGLAPNTTLQDVKTALKALMNFWSYQQGSGIKSLEQWFRNFFAVSYAISFVSGRCALFAVLKSLGVAKGDEVVLQAFTCSVVPHAILECGATPIFADITSSYTIDPVDLERKITKRTKAIIIQHTFGIPADMETILKIAEKNHIPIIEDCAHVLGGEYNGKLLGTFGLASIFSFGRDKAFSSVFGGMAISNDKNFGMTLREFHKKLEYPKTSWILQQVFHPIAFFVILPLYSIIIGKLILVVLQRLKLLSFPLTDAEKKLRKNAMSIKKMPNALAVLALSQLKSVKEFNQKRIRFGNIYGRELHQKTPGDIAYLRYPLLLQNRDEMVQYFRKKHILLGTWYSEIIDPKGIDFKVLGYTMGSCPQAEKIARHIINLPTYPTLASDEAMNIVQLLKS